MHFFEVIFGAKIIILRNIFLFLFLLVFAMSLLFSLRLVLEMASTGEERLGSPPPQKRPRTGPNPAGNPTGHKGEYRTDPEHPTVPESPRIRPALAPKSGFLSLAGAGRPKVPRWLPPALPGAGSAGLEPTSPAGIAPALGWGTWGSPGGATGFKRAAGKST